jgi:predicted nucleic acid-binding protein
MALTHLLDTSVFCQPIKPRPLAPVIQRWQALGDDALAVSVLCQAEILYGIALKGSSRLQAAYEAVLKDRLTVFPVAEAESQTYAESGQPESPP